MVKVAATEFKAKCLELMDRVAEGRESYVITKRGKPVARLVPAEPTPKTSILGWLRGRATITGDVVRPAAPPGAWAVVRERDAELERERRAGRGRRAGVGRRRATRRRPRGSR
jgi:prevent-host-death family protein